MNSRLGKKLREIENKYGHTVFAVTYEEFYFGRVYSFLIVSKYIADWDMAFRKIRSGIYMAHAYCWNIDHVECSEFGSVVLENCFGGVRRVG